MATFTSHPQTLSTQFKFYNPTLPKRTKSKAPAKTTGHALLRDYIKEVAYNAELLHQDNESNLYNIPQQTTQLQTTGPMNEIDSATCELFEADYGQSMCNVAPGDHHSQFGCELLEEAGTGDATYDVASHSATNGLLGGSEYLHSIDTVARNDCTAHVQLGNKASNHQENICDLTAGNGEDHVSRRGDPDAAVKVAVGGGFRHHDYRQITHQGHADTMREESLAENRIYFGTNSMMNGPSATPERLPHTSVTGATTIIHAAATNVISELEPEDAQPAKRQKLAERQASPPEPASTPNSTSPLNIGVSASRSFPRPRASLRKGDSAVDQALPLNYPCDEEQDLDTHFQERYISSLEEVEVEQEIALNTSGCETNQVNSVPRQRMDRVLAPKRKRGLSTTALRYNTVPMGAQQQRRPDQPLQSSMPGRPGIKRRLQDYPQRSASPSTTINGRTNINYRPKLEMSCEMTDLTLCAVPNGSSIMAATVRDRESNQSLDSVALCHKFFGKQGKIIRMIRSPPDSWVLLGYQCNDSVPDLCDRGSINAVWMGSSHSDVASLGTDHSDDDWDEEGKHGDQGTEMHSRRTHKHWLESEEQLLLSLKDKQGMEWKEVCKRFAGRSLGAVKLRYYTLHKRGA